VDWGELANWSEYTKLFIGLLAVSTPLAAAPVFLSQTAPLEPAQVRRVATLTPVAFVVVLWLFVFLGPAILGFFGVTLAAFRVAGGILLLLLGIEMMRAAPSAEPETRVGPVNPVQLAFVPLAIPLTAGPGAITAVIVYGGLHEGFLHLVVVSFVIVLDGLVLALVLHSARWIVAVAGNTAILVVNRIMGLILASIGVEMLLDGVGMHFPGLFGFQGHGVG
jgi:multiple antibiotic resistance protein